MLRPALPFLFAVLISTSIWVINSLNNTHTTSIEFKPLYVHAVTSAGHEYTQKVTATLSGRGFDLITLLFKKNFREFAVTTDSKNRIAALDAVSRHIQGANLNIRVTRVHPAWIDPPQLQQHSRKLKVIVDGDFTVMASHVKTTTPISVPDSITVYSELPIPTVITSIRTRHLTQKQLHASWFGSTQLVNPFPEQLVLAESKVWVYQPVEEATEISLSLPVNPGNGIPYNFRFIPASIKLTCVIPVSRYNITTAEKFLATASVSSPSQELAVIRINQAPPWATHIRYTPVSVKFLRIVP